MAISLGIFGREGGGAEDFGVLNVLIWLFVYIGYTGFNCQTNIDECSSAAPPCLAASTSACSDLPGAYYCLCNSGFTGINCQTVIRLTFCLYLPLYLRKCYSACLSDLFIVYWSVRKTNCQAKWRGTVYLQRVTSSDHSKLNQCVWLIHACIIKN